MNIITNITITLIILLFIIVIYNYKETTEYFTPNANILYIDTYGNIKSTNDIGVTYLTVSKNMKIKNNLNASTIKQGGVILLPKGSISIWYSNNSKEKIPNGWTLCDGTNGTPDLRNKFIIGAGNKYSIGKEGGSKSVILSVNELPSHQHTATDSGHTHNYTEANPIGKSGDRGSGSSYGPSNISGNTSMGNSDITVSETGGVSQHNNMPPYYALYYIMKL